MATDIDIDEIYTQVTSRLQEKFPELDPHLIESAVRAELDEFAGRPVRDYIEVLTERSAKKRLRESRAVQAA
jgi:CRISPR/Cas system-associated protein Cas10 (large subunit of type III CRISPR-Cas system)